MVLQARPNPHGGATSPWVRQAWTTTPASYDILANGPGNPLVQNFGYPCRWITVSTGGTLVYTDTSGNLVTLTADTGERLELEAVSLSGTSTAQGVKVFW